MTNPLPKWTAPHFPLWRQAFRPLFLLSALFSASATLMWGLQFSSLADSLAQHYGLFWHMHEMLFGFAAAIVVGFLLTAAQSWTGLRAVHGSKLQLLVGVWIAARIAMVLVPPAWFLVNILLNVGFYSLAACFLAQLLIKAKSKRNYFFIAVLFSLGVMSGLAHYALSMNNAALQQSIMYAAVLLISQMIMIVGGRVVPMFTANGTSTERPVPTVTLDLCLYLSSWLSIPLVLVSIHEAAFKPFVVVALVLACVTNTMRVVHWYRREIWTAPLVWSLHVGYAFIPVGQGLLALHYAGVMVGISAGIHALTAGAMGSMILTMISRVSLGHTGRALSANRLITMSLIVISLAGLLRVITAVFASHFGASALFFSALLWSLAYFLFIVNYCNILMSPRTDGKDG